jgi:hypothetical protein
MIMQDQSRRLSEPLRWGRREKAVIAAVLGCVVLALIGIGAYSLTSGGTARKDCIEVNFASTLGGATDRACGPAARKLCATPGVFPHEIAEFHASCRRAGFPVD